MSELLLELCSLIRSKNAGPFELTFDFMCRNEETYRRLCKSKILTPELFARLFHTDERHVLFFEHDTAMAVKVRSPVRQFKVRLKTPIVTAGSSTP